MSTWLIVWELLCGALFWSAFCRSVRINPTTRVDMRIAVYLMGAASLVGVGAPLYGWEPDAVSILVLMSAVIMQITTARHWTSGVPDEFVQSRFLSRERRKGDRL